MPQRVSAATSLTIAISVFAALSLLIAYTAKLAICVAALLGLVASASIVKSFGGAAWRGYRYPSALLLIVAGIGVNVSWMLLGRIQREEEEVVRLRAKVTRFQEMRKSDPASYLSELRSSGDERWEAEFRTLDPKGYETFIAERRRSEEAQRKAQLAATLDELLPQTPISC